MRRVWRKRKRSKRKRRGKLGIIRLRKEEIKKSEGKDKENKINGIIIKS